MTDGTTNPLACIVSKRRPLSPYYAKLAEDRRRYMKAIENRRKDNPPNVFFGPEPRRRPRGRISDAMRGAG